VRLAGVALVLVLVLVLAFLILFIYNHLQLSPLQIQSGMNVLVVGPNGSGKSSTFRTLGELWLSS
jgi:ABC-type molybdenum transport system ATPase subunit/photorepair protein PhrA